MTLTLVTNQVASQTTRPAYGGGWANWITVPGWFGSAQQFCDASVASLQHYFGKRAWFILPGVGTYYYVPDSSIAQVRMDSPGLEAVRCLPQCEGGCPINTFEIYGWNGVWVCPKNNVRHIFTGSPTYSTLGYSAPTFLDTYFDRQPYVNFLERQILIGQYRVDCQVSTLPVGSARAKNAGRPAGVCLKGNPINPAIGNKLEHATDYGAGQELRFHRTYNSDTQNVGLLFSNTAFGTQEPSSRFGDPRSTAA